LALLTEHRHTHPDDPRTAFYLAQTYRDLGRCQEAVQMYEQRAEMGNWDEEVYYSLLQVGDLQLQMGQVAEASWAWQRAIAARPTRPESFHRLGRLLNDQSKWPAARVWLEQAATLPPCHDQLFVEGWVQQWGITFELAIARWWTGDRSQANRAFAELIERSDTPAVVRDACQRNLTF
jgi:tetratricopeptide (TPR) repeat protein